MSQTVTQSGLQAPEPSVIWGAFLPSPGCQRRQEGLASVDPALNSPHPHSTLCSSHPPRGTSPSVLPPGRRLLLGPRPFSTHPQWWLSPRANTAFQPLSAGRSVCSFPRRAGFLLYSRRRSGIHGDWGGNTHPKARPIPPDTLVKSLWALAHPGPCLECLLPILTTPTWERSCPGPRVGARPGSSTLESCRYFTAPEPTALPGSRWKPGAGGAHLLPHCVSGDGRG